MTTIKNTSDIYIIYQIITKLTGKQFYCGTCFISDSLKSKVRELPTSKRKELDKVLATPQSDSWQTLAKELGKLITVWYLEAYQVMAGGDLEAWSFLSCTLYKDI